MSDPPPFDEDLAKQLVGKRLLVGLTYVRYSSGELIEQRQLHGVVEAVGPQDILIRLPDGTAFRLPPDLRGVEPAAPGVYRLRSTGEEVVDPDFLCRWTIRRPDA